MSSVLEVSNVILPLDAGLAQHEALLYEAAATALGVNQEALQSVSVIKRSVDARKKSNVHFVVTLKVSLCDEAAEKRVLANADAQGGSGAARGTHVKRHVPYEPLHIPALQKAQLAADESRPIVVGMGPAGLFCALYLARAGLHPIVLERGGDVDKRVQAVTAFGAGGPLDTQTNIQFGAGGAGTFSDGKLTTNIKSPFAAHVLQWFVEAGAPEEIRWQAKPHIGTDLLVSVVRTLCDQIEKAGGELLFYAQLTDFHFNKGALVGVDIFDSVTGETEYIPTRHLVLACGHSARDTFELVHESGLQVQQKPFSVGVRIEHPQLAINRAQYGAFAQHSALGAADYKLAVHLPSGRSAYTFCMCPGGEVVCAASEPNSVVVNGMSRFRRNGTNANSALLVGVDPADFGSDHPLAGVEFQRRMEHAAYDVAVRAGGAAYTAPAQTVGDFLAGRSGTPSTTVMPTYARGVAWCDLHACLPDFVGQALAEALPLLNCKLHGFADPEAVMTGVETRSSSPVRIVRDDTMQAVFAPGKNEHAHGETGIYPCGEGAGYAGGIMSAACDGLRVAQAVCDGAMVAS